MGGIGIIRTIARRTNEYMGAQSLKRFSIPDEKSFGDTFIRPICKRDKIENIKQIHDLSFGFPAPQIPRLKRFSTYYPQFFVIAETDNIVVGYAIFRIVLDISKRGIKRKSHLFSIAIHPDYRRKNNASNLLEFSIESLKGCKISEIYLFVSKENKPALKLYNKFGFEVDRPIKDICGSPNCYLLRKML